MKSIHAIDISTKKYAVYTSLSLFSALLLKPKRCRLAAALRCGANVIRLCSTTGRASETNFCVFIDWSTHSLLSRGSQICFQLGQSVLHASHQIYNVWTSSAILIYLSKVKKPENETISIDFWTVCCSSRYRPSSTAVLRSHFLFRD